jgi:hypothetical protein
MPAHKTSCDCSVNQTITFIITLTEKKIHAENDLIRATSGTTIKERNQRLLFTGFGPDLTKNRPQAGFL